MCPWEPDSAHGRPSQTVLQLGFLRNFCHFLIRITELMIFFLLFFFSFLKDDLENAKYISRLFASRHKFYKQNKICTEWVLLLHSCFLTPCFRIGLSFCMSCCLGFGVFSLFLGFFFFLVTYVSYSFPLSLFFFLFCFNQQQEQTIESEISFWALWALMLPKHQILQGVLNQRPWCLLLIAQSISPNCSERWQRLSCQNVSCSSRCTAHPAAKGAGKCRLSSSSLGRIIYLPLMHAEWGRTPGCIDLCVAVLPQHRGTVNLNLKSPSGSALST